MRRNNAKSKCCKMISKTTQCGLEEGRETMKSEKYNANALEERVLLEEALRVALRKAQAERDSRSKKQSEKIEN